MKSVGIDLHKRFLVTVVEDSRGRAGKPHRFECQDTADAVIFLGSDLSRFVTGQKLVIDGGLGLPQGGIDETLKSLLAMTRDASGRKRGNEYPVPAIALLKGSSFSKIESEVAVQTKG